MEGDSLVVSDISPAFAFARQELGVETPSYDRVDNEVISAVGIILFGDSEELTLAAGGAGSGLGISFGGRSITGTMMMMFFTCLEMISARSPNVEDPSQRQKRLAAS